LGHVYRLPTAKLNVEIRAVHPGPTARKKVLASDDATFSGYKTSHLPGEFVGINGRISVS